MKKKIFSPIFLIIILSEFNLFSLTMREEEVRCPIGGEKFHTVRATSGFVSGQRTDLKSVGAVASPSPLPVCPSNKFVMFKDNFSEKELEVYKKILESPEYRNISSASTYYYLAKFFEFLEKEGNSSVKPVGSQQIAFTFLQASWESEGELRQEALTKSLHYYEKFLNEGKENSGELLTASILVGEINRLLGNFEKSEKHFKNLKNNKEIRKNDYLKKLVDFELKLIKEKNSRPEEIE